MTRDVDNQHFDESSQRWAHLLEGLHGRRRKSVVEALRASVQQGYPASVEGVRILVAYAQGQISARQYAARMLESLDFFPAPPVPPQSTSEVEPLPDLATWRRDEFRRSTLQERQRTPPALAPMARPAPMSRQMSREATVSAYINGRIPVEEFLRLSRARSS